MEGPRRDDRGGAKTLQIKGVMTACQPDIMRDSDTLHVRDTSADVSIKRSQQACAVRPMGADGCQMVAWQIGMCCRAK